MRLLLLVGIGLLVAGCHQSSPEVTGQQDSAMAAEPPAPSPEPVQVLGQPFLPNGEQVATGDPLDQYGDTFTPQEVAGATPPAE